MGVVDIGEDEPDINDGKLCDAEVVGCAGTPLWGGVTPTPNMKGSEVALPVLAGRPIWGTGAEVPTPAGAAPVAAADP
jgi:hypothetical protein